MKLGNYIKGRGIDVEFDKIIWGTTHITNQSFGVTVILPHYEAGTNTIPSFHDGRMLLHFYENLYKLQQYTKHPNVTFALSVVLKRSFGNYDIVLDDYFKDSYVQYIVKKPTTNNNIIFIIAFKKSFEEILKQNNGTAYDMNLIVQTNVFSKELLFRLK